MEKIQLFVVLGCVLLALPQLEAKFTYQDGNFSLFYITAPTVAIARQIGRVLVEKKLAARVTIVENFASMYDSKTSQFYYQEAWMIVIARTQKSQRIRKEVGLKNPIASLDIAGVPIQKGNPAYLEWISKTLPYTARRKPASGGNAFTTHTEHLEEPVKAEKNLEETTMVPENAYEQEQVTEVTDHEEQNANDYELSTNNPNIEEQGMMKPAMHHQHHPRPPPPMQDEYGMDAGDEYNNQQQRNYN